MLPFHHGLRFGVNLQAYALAKSLFFDMGIATEIIDYVKLLLGLRSMTRYVPVHQARAERESSVGSSVCVSIVRVIDPLRAKCDRTARLV
jgi:hypothetical protein